MNVQSAPNAWKVLEDVNVDVFPVITMQECRMSQTDFDAFQNRAKLKGYITHWQPGQVSTGRWGTPWQNGGVITLVSKNIPHKIEATFCSSDGQLLVIRIASFLLHNVYLRPTADKDAFLESCFDLLLHGSTPFLCVGDWNLEPNENPFVDAVSPMNGWLLAVHESTEPSRLRPTRWDGNRTLDYVITNLCRSELSLNFHLTKYGDHIPLNCMVNCTNLTFDQDVSHGLLRKVNFYKPPDNVNDATWRDAIDVAWKVQNFRPFSHWEHSQDGVETYWRQLNIAFEETFKVAYMICQPDITMSLPTHMTASKHSKNSPITVFKRPAKAKSCLTPGHTKVRQLRNAIGRLFELQRYVQKGGWTDQAIKLHRKVDSLFPQQGRSIEIWRTDLSEQEKLLVSEQKISALNNWRKRLRQNPSAQFKWVAKTSNPMTMNLFHSNQPGNVTTTITEAFRMLKDFWITVWNEHESDVQTMYDAWDNATSSMHRESEEWPQLELADLVKHVQKLSGSSAGLDGWSGLELSFMSLDMLRALLAFYQFMEHAACSPKTWSQVRQVHLPKSKGFRPSDHACNVSALRPIGITSIFWRLWASSRIKHASAINWVNSWTPDMMHAGARQKGCYTALQKILCDTDAGYYLASLDYSLAFDRTNPHLALHAFKKLGLPQNIVGLMQGMWCCQKRYFQYMGQTCLEPITVSTALLQGDPWSMIALNACLLAPVLDMKNTSPQSRQTLYVDDRTITSPDISSLRIILNGWERWSRLLGLKENMEKRQFFHVTFKGRKSLTQITDEGITDQPVVLGVTLQGAAARQLGAEENKRVQKAMATAKRCSFLPLNPMRKLQVATITAGAQARYGWAARRPNKSTFDKLHGIYSKMACESQAGSPDLRKIFRGHSADAWLMSGMDQLRAAYRATQDCNTPPVPWASKGPRKKCLVKIFHDLDWKINAPWLFEHDQLSLKISLNPACMHYPESQASLEHLIRESWRCQLFNAWQSSDRRDALLCQNVVYSTARCADARRFAKTVSARNIMTGAFVSPMVFFIQTQENPHGSNRFPARNKFIQRATTHCPFCRYEYGTLDHCVWSCPARELLMPIPPKRPKCPLQSRLGWPRGDDSKIDQQILQVFEIVRSKLLAARWN